MLPALVYILSLYGSLSTARVAQTLLSTKDILKKLFIATFWDFWQLLSKGAAKIDNAFTHGVLDWERILYYKG